MVSRKFIASVLVVLLIGLAGCSAVPFIGEDNTETPTPTPENEINYPYGWNESGLQRFAADDDNAILEEDSVTVKFERKVELDTSSSGQFETESHTVQTHRVNSVQERWNITNQQKQQNVLQQYYFVNDAEYSRTVLFSDSGEIESQAYESSSRNFNKKTAFQIAGGEVLVLGVDYDEPTETTYDGKEALHYEVSGLENVANRSPIYSIGNRVNLTGYQSDLYVSKNGGQILLVETEVSGKRGDDDFRATLSFEYSNFSSTTVTEPDWVEVARNDTDTEPDNVSIDL